MDKSAFIRFDVHFTTPIWKANPLCTASKQSCKAEAPLAGK